MLGASRKAEELRGTIPGAVSLKQFENPANPRTHYETTGPEIWRDLDGHVDWLVAGAGSGGPYSGAVKYLKEQAARVKGVLADPVGSMLGGGCEHADYDIEDIGNDFIPETMDLGLVDEVVKVADADAFEASKLLARAEGIFAGTSSGAALFAALSLARRAKAGNMVAILPDRGDRYFSRGLYEYD